MTFFATSLYNKIMIFYLLIPLSFLIFPMLMELVRKLLALYPEIRSFLPASFLDLLHVGKWQQLSYPMAILVAVGLIFLLEILFLGWKGSSLYQFCCKLDRSLKFDLVYYFLRISGLLEVIIVLSTFGFCYYFFNTGQLNPKEPLFGDYGPMIFILTLDFIQYWAHRLCHSQLVWPLHRPHHTAKQMSVLTSFRFNPLEISLITLIIFNLQSFFNLNHDAFMSSLFIMWFYSMISHSKLLIFPHWISLVFITPQDHRIHHFKDPSYHHKNFGMFLSVWDRVFGTYVSPKDLNIKEPLLGV